MESFGGDVDLLGDPSIAPPQQASPPMTLLDLDTGGNSEGEGGLMAAPVGKAPSEADSMMSPNETASPVTSSGEQEASQNGTPPGYDSGLDEDTQLKASILLPNQPTLQSPPEVEPEPDIEPEPEPQIIDLQQLVNEPSIDAPLSAVKTTGQLDEKFDLISRPETTEQTENAAVEASSLPETVGDPVVISDTGLLVQPVETADLTNPSHHFQSTINHESGESSGSRGDYPVESAVSPLSPPGSVGDAADVASGAELQLDFHQTEPPKSPQLTTQASLVASQSNAVAVEKLQLDSDPEPELTGEEPEPVLAPSVLSDTDPSPPRSAGSVILKSNAKSSARTSKLPNSSRTPRTKPTPTPGPATQTRPPSQPELKTESSPRPRGTPTTIRRAPGQGTNNKIRASSVQKRIAGSVQNKPLPASTPRTPRSTASGSSTPRSGVTTPRTARSVASDGTKVDVKNVTPKIGSLANASYTPHGGDKKVESHKVDFKSNAASKIGSLEKATYKPSGGDVKIHSTKLEFTKKAQSKIGSLQNATYKPSGGNVAIKSEKIDFTKQARSKIGSLNNATHTPGGGKVQVKTEKLDFRNARSKIGSLANAKHVPSGGAVKIYNEKVDFNAKTGSKIGSLENATYQAQGGNVQIYSQKLKFKEIAKPRIGSLENATHVPLGGDVQIYDEKLQFKDTAKPKIGSLDNAQHVPAGGDVQIYNEHLKFKESASPKIGSLSNASHVPAGGDVKIFSQKLEFNETAAPKIGSLDNATHVPGGGDLEVFSEKLDFSQAGAKIGSLPSHSEDASQSISSRSSTNADE